MRFSCAQIRPKASANPIASDLLKKTRMWKMVMVRLSACKKKITNSKGHF